MPDNIHDIAHFHHLSPCGCIDNSAMHGCTPYIDSGACVAIYAVDAVAVD